MLKNANDPIQHEENASQIQGEPSALRILGVNLGLTIPPEFSLSAPSYLGRKKYGPSSLEEAILSGLPLLTAGLGQYLFAQFIKGEQGGRKIVLALNFLSAISVCTMPFVTSYYPLMIPCALGVSLSSINIQLMAPTSEAFSEKNKILNPENVTAGMGMAISFSAALSFFTQQIERWVDDPVSVFLPYTFMGITGFLLSLCYKPTSQQLQNATPFKFTREQVRNIWNSFIQTLKKPQGAVIALGGFVIGGAYLSAITTSATLLEKGFDMSASDATLVTGLGYVLAIISRGATPFFKKFDPSEGPYAAIVHTSLATLTGCMLAFMPHEKWITWLCMLAIPTFWGGALGNTFLCVHKWGKPVGDFFSLLATAGFLSAALYPLIYSMCLALFDDPVHAFQAFMLISFGLGAVSSTAIGLMHKKTSKENYQVLEEIEMNVMENTRNRTATPVSNNPFSFHYDNPLTRTIVDSENLYEEESMQHSSRY